jgi:hypothetical protein
MHPLSTSSLKAIDSTSDIASPIEWVISRISDAVSIENIEGGNPDPGVEALAMAVALPDSDDEGT